MLNLERLCCHHFLQQAGPSLLRLLQSWGLEEGLDAGTTNSKTVLTLALEEAGRLMGSSLELVCTLCLKAYPVLKLFDWKARCLGLVSIPGLDT